MTKRSDGKNKKRGQRGGGGGSRQRQTEQNRQRWTDRDEQRQIDVDRQQEEGGGRFTPLSPPLYVDGAFCARRPIFRGSLRPLVTHLMGRVKESFGLIILGSVWERSVKGVRLRSPLTARSQRGVGSALLCDFCEVAQRRAEVTLLGITRGGGRWGGGRQGTGEVVENMLGVGFLPQGTRPVGGAFFCFVCRNPSFCVCVCAVQFFVW